MPLDLSNIEKAVSSLGNSIDLYHIHAADKALKDALRDSVIQRFEYTYELAWKMLQRWVKHNISPEDAEPRSKKEMFRLGARHGLIDNPEDWFSYMEARNTSVHTYNEANAAAVLQVSLRFYQDVITLLFHLQKRND